MFHHLEWIDLQYNTEVAPEGRYTWHYIWATIFHFFHIDNNQIFLRAYIIHIGQVLISFFAVFFFSKVIIKNTFIKIESFYVNYLAYWSTLIWFTIFATSSIEFYQVWILWYSINYQISLPFVLFITGLTLSLVFENLSLKKKIFYSLLILFFSFLILKIHAMEYLYFLMYLSILALSFIDKIYIVFKKNIYYSIPVSIFSIIVLIEFLSIIKQYSYRLPPILKYMSFEKLPDLFSKISENGQYILLRLNRASSSINELIYLTLSIFILMLIILIYRRYKNVISHINTRMFIFIFITSLFILIPITEFTAGLASLITYPQITHRFYYSSLIFIGIPIVVFYLLSIIGIKKLSIVNITIIAILLGTFIYSKHFSNTHNYYKNIISIQNSFDERNIGFNLSATHIITIENQLKSYELNTSKEDLYFYAREDIAFILQKVYNKRVYLPKHWKGKKLNAKKYIQEYKKDTKHANKILFPTPIDFPPYQSYK